MSEIVIEIKNSKNRLVTFHPLREALRPNWASYRVAGSAPKLAALPEIPGIHIAVDIDSKVCRVYDPLEKNPELWARIQNVIDANSAHLRNMKPWPERIYENSDETTVKTWLWWMRRMVNCKLAVVSSGVLPNADEILAMPGKAVISQGNSHARRQFTADEDSPLGERYRSNRKREKQIQQPTGGR